MQRLVIFPFTTLATLCGVLSGGAIWGITGMFLAIPLLSILKLIFDATEIQPPDAPTVNLNTLVYLCPERKRH